jgi:hypothetical protein
MLAMQIGLRLESKMMESSFQFGVAVNVEMCVHYQNDDDDYLEL